MPLTRTVFVFSGQGSHYYGMGKALFDSDPIFRGHMTRLDHLAHSICGERVLDAVFAGKMSESFDRILFTHPAIFMVEYALALRLMAGGITPDAVLGVSLGTFAAATIAGCMDEESAMRAVIAQAGVFQSSCKPGGMIAILDAPSLHASERFLAQQSELAAVHFDKHFVVAAPAHELDAIQAELKRRGITHQRLAVSFAFHSRWIDDARAPFLDAIRDLMLHPTKIPLICCERANTVTATLTHDDLWRVARNPIRFFETASRLDDEGPCRYIDVGPSGTMATFLKYALPASSASTAHAVITPYGQDMRNLAALLAVR